MAKESKEIVYKKVLNAAIELDIQLGNLKWTYTKLAKRSSISRSLIYYYFGKSKINILKEACHLFGDEFSGFEHERMQAWKRGDLAFGLKKTKELVEDYPYLIPFYFLYRLQENEIGALIKEHEQEGMTKIQKFFPQMSLSDVRTLFALHLGLTMAPFTEIEDVEKGIKYVSKGMNLKF